MNPIDEMTGCESFVLSVLRSADEALTVDDLASGELSVEQFGADEIEDALRVLESHTLASQTFAGWWYVRQPGE